MNGTELVLLMSLTC